MYQGYEALHLGGAKAFDLEWQRAAGFVLAEFMDDAVSAVRARARHRSKENLAGFGEAGMPV